jgi:hypothetical protein
MPNLYKQQKIVKKRTMAGYQEHYKGGFYNLGEPAHDDIATEDCAALQCKDNITE